MGTWVRGCPAQASRSRSPRRPPSAQSAGSSSSLRRSCTDPPSPPPGPPVPSPTPVVGAVDGPPAPAPRPHGARVRSPTAVVGAVGGPAAPALAHGELVLVLALDLAALRLAHDPIDDRPDERQQDHDQQPRGGLASAEPAPDDVPDREGPDREERDTQHAAQYLPQTAHHSFLTCRLAGEATRRSSSTPPLGGNGARRCVPGDARTSAPPPAVPGRRFTPFA